MYRVYVKYEGTEFPLYEPLDDEMRIFEPVLTEGAGIAGTFVFQIYRGHPNFDKIKACKSEVALYRDDDAIFYGRVFRPEQGFNNMVTFTCEGSLTYLLDSMQRPFLYSGTLGAYFGKLLEIHNSQVLEDKRVEIGNVVVTGGSSDNVWTLAEYTPTLAVMRKIKDTYGGYLRIRNEAGKRYLDYLWDYGGINSQVIRFGENMLDLTKYVDASQIITCLIPVGGEVEYKDELGEKQRQSVDITSVNDGKDYIENAIAVEKYGRIWSTQKFDDVTDPQKLIEKATAYLEEASAMPESVVINAVDLSLIESDVEQFRIGYWTDVSSAPHGIEQRYMLSERVVNLLDPTQGSITLGRELDTFTGNADKSQEDISNRIEKVAAEASEEINRKVENATELITGGLGGYVVLDSWDPKTGKKMHPWRILIMNTPDKATAINVIQINQNGLGFSTTGINGPYRNAWTIDGSLVADFITAGTMLADRIRGGTLEVGGKGPAKDGVIYVKDASGGVVGQIDTNGITINKGSINLGNGNFVVTSGGVLTLKGTSNNTSVGADLVNCNTLRVSDQIMASGASFNLGGMYSTGSYVHGSFMGDFHGSFNETSDRRKKKKIRPLKEGMTLALVLGLKPVSFVMKETGEPMMGFVAQDVEKLKKQLGIELPLTSMDNDGYYCIPYMNYIALLTGALQDQQKQINQLMNMDKKGGRRWLISVKRLMTLGLRRMGGMSGIV